MLEPNLETGLSMYVCDGDFVSIYPSNMCALNISRMTLSSVMFEMEGRPFADIPAYFACLVNVRENSETLCSNYHGMPTYREMYKLISKQLQDEEDALYAQV